MNTYITILQFIYSIKGIYELLSWTGIFYESRFESGRNTEYVNAFEIGILILLLTYYLLAYLLICEIKPRRLLILSAMCNRAFDVSTLNAFGTVTSNKQYHVILGWVGCRPAFSHLGLWGLHCHSCRNLKYKTYRPIMELIGRKLNMMRSGLISILSRSSSVTS